MKLANIFDRHWETFAGMKPYLLNAAHHRAAQAVLSCRTAALGAQVHECEDCQRKQVQYHSCHHRACPQCDKHKQQEWSQQQEAKLLDVGYYMLTFTLPAELRNTCYKNQQWFYGLMFDTMRDTLKALDLQHRRLVPDGAKHSHTQGFTAVLHTWTREMEYHPHLHVVMPGVSLASDGQRIHRPGRANYLIPHRALAKRFKILLRRKLAEHDAMEGRTDLSTVKPAAWAKRWVVDVQSVGSGREALRYLSRYVHRTALSEERLVGEAADGRIKLNCQHSRTRQWRIVSLAPHELLRRWCLHVLPKGFTRVRHYGFLSAAAVEKFGQIRRILQMPETPRPPRSPIGKPECPCCKRPMKLLGTWTRHGDWIPAAAVLFELGMATLWARRGVARPPPADTG